MICKGSDVCALPGASFGDFSVAQAYKQLCGGLIEPVSSFWARVCKINAPKGIRLCGFSNTINS